MLIGKPVCASASPCPPNYVNVMFKQCRRANSTVEAFLRPSATALSKALE
jgi:hypothetical protein